MKVKILICCHEPTYFPYDSVFTPLYVGHALAYEKECPTWFRDALFDDEGENISAKNPTYNELTGIYWAWKHYDRLGDPDFVGFMHYRRHLIFDERVGQEVVRFEEIGEDYLSEIGYPDGLYDLLERFDFLYLKGKVHHVYAHYAENHDVADLEAAVKIVKKKHPSYRRSAARFLRGSEGCFCNCFVFPKKMFFSYCKFLFGVLEEYEKKRRSAQKRLFVSERLTGIFVQKQIDKGIRGAPLMSTLVRKRSKQVVCIPYDQKSVFAASMTLCSIAERAKKEAYYVFYLLTTDGGNDGENMILQKQYKNHKIVRIDVSEIAQKLPGNAEDLQPFFLVESLPEEGETLFVKPGVVARQDIETILENVYLGDNAARIGPGVCVADVTKIRKMGLRCEITEKIEKGIPVSEIWKSCIANCVKSMPAWVIGGTSCKEYVRTAFATPEAGNGRSERACVALAAARVPCGIRAEEFCLPEEKKIPSAPRGKKRDKNVLSRICRYLKRNGVRRTYARIKWEIMQRI